MNAWQAAQQIRYILQTATWNADAPEGGQPIVRGPIFGSVRITQGIGKDEGMGQLRFPCAFISLQDSESDGASPSLKLQRWSVSIAVANQGDVVGETAMVGGQRQSGFFSSGRGLLEVEEAMLDVLNLADETSGVRIILVSSSAPEATFSDSYGYVAERTYVFASVISTERTFPRPNGGNVLDASLGTPAGGNTPVNLSWSVNERRFDLHEAFPGPPVALQARGQFLLTRLSGASHPTYPTNGTQLALASSLSAGFGELLPTGSGAYSYSLFSQFDEYGDASTSLRLSLPSYASVTV